MNESAHVFHYMVFHVLYVSNFRQEPTGSEAGFELVLH